MTDYTCWGESELIAELEERDAQIKEDLDTINELHERIEDLNLMIEEYAEGKIDA